MSQENFALKEPKESSRSGSRGPPQHMSQYMSELNRLKQRKEALLSSKGYSDQPIVLDNQTCKGMESSSNQMSTGNLGTLTGVLLTGRTDSKFDAKFQLDEIQSDKILVEEKNAPTDIFEEESKSEQQSPVAQPKKLTAREQTTPKREKNIGEVL